MLILSLTWLGLIAMGYICCLESPYDKSIDVAYKEKQALIQEQIKRNNKVGLLAGKEIV